GCGGARPLLVGTKLLALADQAAQLGDLLQEAIGTLVFLGAALGAVAALAGRVVVAEHVAGLDLAALQPVAQSKHRVDGQVEGEDGPADLAPASLDLLGDRDLLLSGEAGDAAQLLPGHTDRIS